MTDDARCPGCGQVRPIDAPGGFCPACLLKRGLEQSGPPLHDVTVSFGPASSERLADLAESLGGLPRILLRDTDPGPVSRSSSEEMPAADDRSARLQIFGEIARGGMGAVLKGRDPDLGREVAVKVLLDSHRDKPDLVRRFVEEAQIGGQLQHPGIVPIYELGAFSDRRPYFAMKLVKGRTLASLLSERPSPAHDLSRFLSIFEAVCQTMAYAHARGVIHRDLKPSNVMVGSFGEVQVMDWGLAKVLPQGGAIDDATAGRVPETIISTNRADSNLSRAGSVLGTPAYMSPEQACGEVDLLDERCDVFALGSILCEILTGSPAFTGRSSAEIQRRASLGDLSDALARLSASGADPDLVALVTKCLACERDDRPRHAGEVSGHLSYYLASVQERLRAAELAHAAETARAEGAEARARAERRSRLISVGLAASILITATTIGGAWALVNRQGQAHRAATDRVVTAAIDEAILLRGQAKATPADDLSKWTTALKAAKQARALLLSGVANAATAQRANQLLATLEQEHANAMMRASELEKDRKFVGRLRQIRLQNFDLVRHWGMERADVEYAKAFREFGIDINKLSPAESARLLKARSIAMELIGYLDDWGMIRYESIDSYEGPTTRAKNAWQRPLQVASAADTNGWCNSLRASIGDKDAKKLKNIAEDVKSLEAQPTRGLLLLARLLAQEGFPEQGVKVLKLAWSMAPNDPWINSRLAQDRYTESTPSKADDLEKLRFATAAVALQPDNAWGRFYLAGCLQGEPKFSDDVTIGMALTTSFSDRRDLSATGKERPKPHGTLNGWSYTFLKTDSGADLEILNVDPYFFEPSEDVVRELRRAVALDPSNSAIHRRLAELLVHDPLRLEEAIAEFRKAILMSDHPGMLHRRLGNHLILHGKYREAIPEIRVSATEEKSIYDHLVVGWLLHKVGVDKAAFAEFRDAMLNWDEKWIPFVMALTNHTGKDKKIMSSDCLRVIDAFLRMTGTDEERLTVYRDRIRSHSNDVFSFTSIGEIYRSQRNKREEQAIYRKGIQLNPDSPLFHKLLADALDRHGNSAEAVAERKEELRLLRQIAAANRNDVKAHEELANALFDRGLQNEGSEEYRNMLKLKPDHPHLWNDVAWIFATSADLKRRNGVLAVEFATRACELTEWKEPAYLDTLAAAHAEAGDFDDAVRRQTEAISLLTDAEEKEDYGTRLKLYQDKKPYRAPE